ncbi:Gfo/Idh/MocA family protein [Arthrobacter sp. SA17]
MIGTGWMGSAIAPDFKLCEATELVAVSGRNPDRTIAFAASHDIPNALEAERLITNDDVELVYIASTHETHFDLAASALEAGKAVMVEKAFTVDTGEAARLIDMANARGLFLMEAMWMYFNPVVSRLKKLLTDGAIGEPRTLQASFGTAVPMNQDNRLWDPARAGAPYWIKAYIRWLWPI